MTAKCRELFDVTGYIDNPDALGPFITELFARTRTTGGFGWTPRQEDSCYFDCLTYFVEENLWRWFLENRLEAGWVPPENCEIQRDQSHAESKNNTDGASAFEIVCEGARRDLEEPCHQHVIHLGGLKLDCHGKTLRGKSRTLRKRPRAKHHRNIYDPAGIVLRNAGADPSLHGIHRREAMHDKVQTAELGELRERIQCYVQLLPVKAVYDRDGIDREDDGERGDGGTRRREEFQRGVAESVWKRRRLMWMVSRRRFSPSTKVVPN
ncbi:hypothetical protein B0H11DRAFT_1933442 [Mycena galericulata]|nr:hypothetical protein B0H11DRAFT_1933442 [Mycena galericulata]